jgi:hypothetical protein
MPEDLILNELEWAACINTCERVAAIDVLLS